ncbi:MAG: Carboxymethylenebutenolidase [Acidimicrobiales bacterium]|jgi:carboxymethylenebutenolidase|nr:Carboxymethylenebutenolidase [Acidimicrobiales bacterium]
MGETVEFPSNGGTASGYLAHPATGAGPAVIVVQEWWGLVPQIRAVCDRLAAEGFTALAPDLYHGEQVTHTEPDKAGALMMQLQLDQVSRDMASAIDYLGRHDAVRGEGVGVVGFCMGGGLTFLLACRQPDDVKAAVAYYGVIPWGDKAQPDWARLASPLLGHFGEKDDFFPVDEVRRLEQQLRDLGKDVEFYYYPEGGHGFANEDRADAYDERSAREAWVRTLEFLRAKLG